MSFLFLLFFRVLLQTSILFTPSLILVCFGCKAIEFDGRLTNVLAANGRECSIALGVLEESIRDSERDSRKGIIVAVGIW